MPAARAGRRVLRGESGVTLVELLIAAAIAAVLATALAHVFTGVLDLARTARSGRDLERETDLTVKRLREDVSGARRVMAATATSLDLQLLDGSLVSYALAGSDSLQRRVDAGAWLLVSSGVDSLAFGLQTVARPYTCEKMMPDTIEALLRSFEPGDLDAHIASTHCNYESRGERRIQDDDYVMVQFWQQAAGYFAFSRVEVRLRATDHIPCESNLWVKIHKSDFSGWPGVVVAQGTFSRFSVPVGSYDWVSINLTPTVYEAIPEDGDYWLVLGSSGSGGSSYAGHFEYERIKDCWGSEWPVNNTTFWYTTSGYSNYNEGGYNRDGFHRIYGQKTVDRLTEVTETITDTLGVTYGLVLGSGEESELRAGYIALYSP